MTWKLITGSLAALAFVAGCASHAPDISATDTASSAPGISASDTSSSEKTCNADSVENIVGQKFSPGLLDTARQRAQAKLARALRPTDVITMEYNPQRLNLRLDEQDIVISVNCS